MQTKEEIFEKIKEIMQELFEIDPNEITLDSKLYEELDLDSIDAVDLVLKLKEITGKMANPEEFKATRTVGDVVDVIHKLLH